MTWTWDGEAYEFAATIRHRGRTRDDLKREVMALEKESQKSLKGELIRTSKFIDGGERCIFTWRLKNG